MTGNTTTKKLERLLLDNGFTKTEAKKFIGGWGGNIDVFQFQFKKGNENVFITVNKPQKGTVPMSYEEYTEKKKKATAIKKGRV